MAENIHNFQSVANYNSDIMYTFPSRTVGDIFRVVARERNTELNWNGEQRTIRRAGDHIDIDVSNSEAFRLKASK